MCIFMSCVVAKCLYSKYLSAVTKVCGPATATIGAEKWNRGPYIAFQKWFLFAKSPDALLN